jgi:hypothetical protein
MDDLQGTNGTELRTTQAPSQAPLQNRQELQHVDHKSTNASHHCISSRLPKCVQYLHLCLLCTRFMTLAPIPGSKFSSKPHSYQTCAVCCQQTVALCEMPEKKILKKWMSIHIRSVKVEDVFNYLVQCTPRPQMNTVRAHAVTKTRLRFTHAGQKMIALHPGQRSEQNGKSTTTRPSTTRHSYFFFLQTSASWQSPLTKRYSREFTESGIRAVQCYDCPTAQCGSGRDT